MKMSEINKEFAPTQPGNYFRIEGLGTVVVRLVSELYPVKKAPSKNRTTGKTYEARTVFLCRVIDRRDDKIKLWEMPTVVKNQLLALAADDEFGFEEMPNYDIKVTKTMENGFTKYAVLPGMPKPLTEVEAAGVATESSVEEIQGKTQAREKEKFNQWAAEVSHQQEGQGPESHQEGEVNPEDLPF